MVQEMSLKDISYPDVWQPHFQRSKTICEILVEGIMRNNYVKLFVFGPVVQEMSFKDISYLELWQPYC